MSGLVRVVGTRKSKVFEVKAADIVNVTVLELSINPGSKYKVINSTKIMDFIIKEEVEEKFDLYAEDDMNLAMQFPVSSNNTPGDADTDELFNDVVTDRVNYGVNDNNNGSFNGSAENDNVEESEGERGFVKGGPPLARKFNIYVGNLTWWTTDQQMEDVMKEIGVEDLIEIKFYENRSNGQSKGYCNVIVNSQNSITLIREKLPRREIHGKMPIVEVASKAALAQFESQAKTRPCPAPGAPVGCVPRNSIPGIPPYGMMPMGPRMNGPPIRPGRCGPPSPHGMSPPRNMLGMPHPHHPPPGHPSNFPHRPPMDLHRPPFRPHHQPMNMHCPVPNPGGMGHPGHHHPRPEWMRPPGAHHQYPCHPGLMQPNTGGPPMGSMGVTNAPPGVHGASSSSPLPHVNPAFFQPHHFSGPPPPGTMCGQGDNGSPISGLESRSRNNEAFPSPKKERNTFPTLNDEEVEEIMSRNRSVSSSAISRAVSDAATGDFASAIETLVTAISLIRQSKVASEDRCKVLLDSLKDTLGGIESKSYGRAREHARSRSRSRSREQNRHRRTRYYRSRSRGRSRSRERYFETRRSRSPSRSREIPERSSRSDERERYRRFERESLREMEKDRERAIKCRSREEEREHNVVLDRGERESHRLSRR